jgi:transposase
VKSYRAYAPEQPYLLPPSPREWLPSGHLALFVLDLVRELDLSAIEGALQRKDPRGERPYAPTMMTALLIYAYATGVYSSRRIERATIEDVACRVLAAGAHPHFTTINQFRAVHRQALADLFVQVLRACQSAGLVQLEHVAIDGTKMKANASKHKAMSYDRMQKDEVRLRAEVEAWLARAETEDVQEDAATGPIDPAEEIRRREERLAKMAAAREALRRETAAARAARLREQAAELREKASAPATSPSKQGAFTTLAAKREQQAAQLEPQREPAAERDDDDRTPPPASPTADLPRNTPPTTPAGEPKPEAQRNFTDPESRIMVRDGAFIQAYNAQIAVDEAHQIIVAAAVSNQAPDSEYFQPMLRRVVHNCDAVPTSTTGDSGYFSAANVQFAEHMGTVPLISVGKHRNDGTLPAGEAPGRHRTVARLEMRARLETPEGRARYARRKATVEPVFGQVRACRGFRQFSFRGLVKNHCEWAFVCLTHNLLKLFRAHQQPTRQAPVPC